MRKYKFDDVENAGNCFLIYGDMGVGKTHALGTLPEPVLIIVTEAKDPRRTLSWAKGKDITFVEYSNYQELVQGLNSLYETYEEGKKPFNSVAVDSLSFLQSKFKIDIEDSRFEKDFGSIKASGKEITDTLLDRFRMERSDWNPLGSIMKRITRLLNQISKFGVNVVATATVVEYPKWNKALVAAPSFQGVDFSSIVQGYFDHIALVLPNPNGGYPPVAHFKSNGDFMARCGSASLNAKGGVGTLDFQKILKLMEEDYKIKTREIE